MKKTPILALVLMFALLLTACKKEDNVNSQNSSSENTSGSSENNDESNNSGENDGYNDDYSNYIASEGLIFLINEGGKYYSVTGIGTCSDKALAIPYQYNGLPVKYVEDEAFAFTEIESLIIPNSIEAIGKNAFNGCDRLKNVKLGTGIKSIGAFAFADCIALEDFYFNAAEMDTYSYKNYAFNNAGAGGNGIKLVIGRDVTIIPNDLFASASFDSFEPKDPKIISVEFEKGSVCKTIGSAAFYGCDSIKSVILNDNIESIGTWAFRGCDSITEVKLGIKLSFIGESAFRYCSNLKSIKMYDNVTTIGKYAFSGCENIEQITIPESVKYLGSGALEYCESLKEIHFNANIITTEDYSGEKLFYHSNYDEIETKVFIGKNVKKIPDNLFTNSRIISVEFEEGSVCTSIGKESFRSCTHLKEVNLPDGLTYIGNSAFYDCHALTNITIPDSVTSIGDYAFFHCYNITTLNMGNSINSIGKYAFSGCTSLSSITLSESLTHIGAYAFVGCKNLKSVTFKNLNGWACFDENSLSDKTTISADELKSTDNAATYLTATHSKKIWERN